MNFEWIIVLLSINNLAAPMFYFKTVHIAYLRNSLDEAYLTLKKIAPP